MIKRISLILFCFANSILFADSYDELYCVIDLSGGTNAVQYAVTYLNDIPVDGWTDEYKTSKIVLRRIDPGKFLMGSPNDELGRKSNEQLHEAVVSNDFYVGVFEVTQRQWELVMGNRPSYLTNDMCYATRPVECVSFAMARGANYELIDQDSFVGILRAKTKLDLDLPLEEQWEYACRAGTSTSLNSGKNILSEFGECSNMAEVGRYTYNSGDHGNGPVAVKGGTTEWGTAAVGNYVANAWGLYDMHGNVAEWCNDRVTRGGSWTCCASESRSAYRSDRSGFAVTDRWIDVGVRLCCSGNSVRLIALKNIGASDGSEPGAGVIPEGGLSTFDATYVKDGAGHTINTQALYAVTVPASTPSFSFAKDDGGQGLPALPDEPNWVAEPPTYTNAGKYVVWYRITAPNYSNYIHSARVTITNKPVRVMSAVAQQRYPWNGLVDIDVTFDGEPEDLAKVECTFAATNCTTQAALSITTVSRAGIDTGSGRAWKRRYVWDAAADVGDGEIGEVVMTVGVRLRGVQLWENGPYWAECNVGALSPEDSGYYFWWGDTVGYKRNENNDGWVSVKDGTPFEFTDSNCSTMNKSLSDLMAEGYVDSTTNLVAAHDAATTHLGAPWRMPTFVELCALGNNCVLNWITTNGVHGLLATGKGSYTSKSVFLPAAGKGEGSSCNVPCLGTYFWSSTSSLNSSYNAYWFYFFPAFRGGGDYLERFVGLPVRPVRDYTTVAALSTSGELPGDATCAFKLSLKNDGVRVSDGAETLRYSSLWDGGSNETAKVTIKQGETVLVENLVGEGSESWHVTRPGLYTLTHTTYTNSVVAKTLTAKFNVSGVPIDPAEVVATPYDGVYDGAAHGISVVGPAGTMVKYCAVSNGVYTTSLTFTGICSTQIWYEVSGGGWLAYTNSASFRITIPDVSDERYNATVREDLTVVLNQAGTDVTGAVTVPSQIRGFPVVEIAPGAFFGRQDITSIVVPGTVTNIGHHAFACCSNLVSLTLPATLAGAGRFLCAECPKLATYVLPEDVEVSSCPTDGSGNQVISVKVVPHVTWTEAPWDGRYDITYSVLGAKIAGAAAVGVRVTATDGVREWSVAMLSGDSSPGAGEHTLVWDAWAELGEAYSAKLTLKVALVRLDGQSETLPPLDGSYACDLSLASFRTTEGALLSPAFAVDFTSAKPIRCRLASDGTLVITNGAYTAEGVAIVPETIDGRVVSGVAEGAYLARAGGVRFDVPTSAHLFDASATAKWSGLKSVVTTLAFSSSTTNYSIAAFRQFVNLTRVIFEGSPEGLSDSLLSFLRTSGLEIVYAEEYADAWAQALARFASASVTVISAAARANDAMVLDVVYQIMGTTNALPARAIFFKDNVRSFANVVLPYTFADGTENELGEAMAPAVEHHFAWKVSEDWQIDLAKVRAEVMILPGELLPLKFFTIPANGSHAAMTVSRNALTESRVLDALFWLYAGGEKDLTLKDGVLKCGDTVLAEGASPNGATAVEYLFGKMGLRLLTGAELEYVNDCARLGFTPQGVRQYAVKEAK